MTIQDLVRTHSMRAPGRTALVIGRDAALTYLDVAAAIERVSSMLRAAGVGAGHRVAVLGRGGSDLALAMLGTLATAVAAPVDPMLPMAGLERQLERLQPRCMLVDHERAEAVRPVADALRIALVQYDRSLLIGMGAPVEQTPMRDGPGPEDVALLLQTSGTTGASRLVPLTHANLAASATAIAEGLALQPGDRCLNLMPLHHGHGLIGGLLASIAAGASIHCAPPGTLSDFAAISSVLRPTWLTATPTILRALLESAPAALHGTRELRFIRSCSSPLPADVAAQLEDAFNVPVIQAYGMTETAHQITSNPLPPSVRKPGSVGLPSGTRVRILDTEGLPITTPGVCGEVVVSGPSVMHGYLEDPIANTAVFHEGWLRTGDFGYLDSDGYLYLVGRIKEIVNRGGESIAPHEVDLALLSHPQVHQAAAFAVPHPRLGEDVAAAVVLRPGADVSEDELRAHAAGAVSPSRVPSRIWIVEHIPTTATGKPERSKLARELSAGSSSGDAHGTELTPIEVKVAQVWRDVLHVDNISTQQNFFADLNGDSLLALQVICRLAEQMQVDIPPDGLFRHPTLTRFASLVDAAPAKPQMHPHSLADTPARASLAQERIWFLEQLQPGTRAFVLHDQLRIRGPLDVGLLRQALREVVQQHDIFRTRFETADDHPVQLVEPTLNISVPLLDLSNLSHTEREIRLQQYIEAELVQAFDLRRLPLVRWSLVRVSALEHVLIQIEHHVLHDAWSLHLFARELGRVYAALQRGPFNPGALPVTFAEIAQAERRWLESPAAARELVYWRQQLADLSGVLELPTDHPRPAVQQLRTSSVRIPLESELISQLRALARS